MPSSPKEVFELFTRESSKDNLPEVGLLAYGAFAAELYEWADHEGRRLGRPVVLDEINAWVAQLPDGRLRRIREDALESFGLAAKIFLEPEIERQRREAVAQSILKEVRQYTSSLRAFGLNILAGILAAMVFAVMALGFYYYVEADPSPVGQAKELLDKEAP